MMLVMVWWLVFGEIDMPVIIGKERREKKSWRIL